MGVAVHRVAVPDHLMPGGLHLLDDRRQQIAHLVIAQSGYQGESAGFVVRIKPLDVLDGQLRGHRRADLHPDRVGDHLGEGDVRAVELAGALPDPDVVRREVVEPRLAELGAQPQHGTLVVEHQRLMTGVDVGGVEVAVVDPARAHEPHSAVDLRGQRLIAGTGRRGADELPVPVVHQVQRRQTRRGKRPHQVHRGAGVGVRPHQAGGIVVAHRGIRGETVDHVAAVGPQPEGVGVRRPRLGVLPGDPGHLDHGHARAVGQHHRHLQQGADIGSDVRLGVVDERLGAVAALQQERLPAGHRGQLVGQFLDLRGDGDRRHALEHRPHGPGLLGIPAGLLGGGLGQRRVQAGAQVRRERRQRRQLVDRYVNGPVHPSMVTGLSRPFNQAEDTRRAGYAGAPGSTPVAIT